MGAEAAFRLILAAILGSAILISAYHRHRARQSTGTIARRAEAPRLIALRLLFAVPLLLSLLAYIAWPELVGWARMPLPVAVRWLGVALGLACIALVYRVLISIGSNISETVLTKSDHRLVTTGAYRRVRHPLYSTGLLLLVAATLVSASGLIAALTLAAALAIRFVVIPLEEAALLEKFGDRYGEYMARTGRLLPVRRS